MDKDKFKVFILLFTFKLALLEREYYALVNLKEPVLNISGVVILLTKWIFESLYSVLEIFIDMDYFCLYKRKNTWLKKKEKN